MLAGIGKINILKDRYSKYPTITVNPDLFNNVLVLATEEELRIIEFFIAKLYRQELTLKFHHDYATYTEMNLIDFKIYKEINSNFIAEINIKRIGLSKVINTFFIFSNSQI